MRPGTQRPKRHKPCKKCQERREAIGRALARGYRAVKKTLSKKGNDLENET